MSDTDANDYDKSNKALLTRYNYTEDGYRKRFREVKPETDVMPVVLVLQINELGNKRATTLVFKNKTI